METHRIAIRTSALKRAYKCENISQQSTWHVSAWTKVVDNWRDITLRATQYTGEHDKCSHNRKIIESVGCTASSVLKVKPDICISNKFILPVRKERQAANLAGQQSSWLSKNKSGNTARVCQRLSELQDKARLSGLHSHTAMHHLATQGIRLSTNVLLYYDLLPARFVLQQQIKAMQCE